PSRTTERVRQVQQPRGQLGPAWGETAVLAYQVRQGTEAVPSLVQVPESQPASRVFRPDGQLLGFGLQPPQVQLPLQVALPAVEKALVLEEINRPEVR